MRVATVLSNVSQVGKKFKFNGREGDIDIVKSVGGKTFFGESKLAGNFKNVNFEEFMNKKGYRDQFNALEGFAKQEGAAVEYYFKKGEVSDSIMSGLRKKGITVKEIE